MEVVEFVKNYWTQIVFLVGVFAFVYKYFKNSNDAMRCSLRNDILEIYDKCKETKTITLYQLQSVSYSFEAYKKLKGNSFVEDIVNEMKTYDRIS